MSSATQHTDRNTNESSPLLNNGHRQDAEAHRPRGAQTTSNYKVRIVVWGTFTLVFLVMLVILLAFQDILGDGIKSTLGIMPKDPMRAAFVILDKAPVIVSPMLKAHTIAHPEFCFLYRMAILVRDLMFWEVVLCLLICIRPSYTCSLPLRQQCLCNQTLQRNTRSC